MKTKLSPCLFIVLCAAMIFGVSCSSTGVENNMQSSQTQVSLTHANYKVLKAGAMGRSYGFRFLLGIIPITAPSTAEARADLYGSLGQSMNGKSVALVNVTEDHSTTGCSFFPSRKQSSPVTWWSLTKKNRILIPFRCRCPSSTRRPPATTSACWRSNSWVAPST